MLHNAASEQDLHFLLPIFDKIWVKEKHAIQHPQMENKLVLLLMDGKTILFKWVEDNDTRHMSRFLWEIAGHDVKSIMPRNDSSACHHVNSVYDDDGPLVLIGASGVCPVWSEYLFCTKWVGDTDQSVFQR